MNIKNKITYSLEDFQETLLILARKQGVIARKLTEDELKILIGTGSVTIEVECPTDPILEKITELPFKFLSDCSSRVQGLSVFIYNISEEILYKYLTPIFLELKENDRNLLLSYYQAKTTKFPVPGPKEIFGETWREKFEKIGEVSTSMGQKLLSTLQTKLRNGLGEIKGLKNFKKDTVIKHEDEINLGLSKRVMNTFLYRRESAPFVLGEYFTKGKIREGNRRNFGEKCIKEIEDFILLYQLD